jgi:hypothetical protein
VPLERFAEALDGRGEDIKVVIDLTA